MFHIAALSLLIALASVSADSSREAVAGSEMRPTTGNAMLNRVRPTATIAAFTTQFASSKNPPLSVPRCPAGQVLSATGVCVPSVPLAVMAEGNKWMGLSTTTWYWIAGGAAVLGLGIFVAKKKHLI